MRDLVAEKVYACRQQAEVKKFLGRLRGQALIVWKNEALKKAYEDQVRSEDADRCRRALTTHSRP